VKKEDIKLFLKYVLNRIDYDKFSEIIKESVQDPHESYIKEKWENFKVCNICFLLNFSESIEIILEMIKKEDYKG